MTYSFIDKVSHIVTLKGDDLYFFGTDHALKKFSFKRKDLVWSTLSDTQYLMLEDNEFIYPYRKYDRLYKLSKSDGHIVQRLVQDFFPVKLQDGFIYGELKEDNAYWFVIVDTKTLTIEKKFMLADKQLILIDGGKALLQKGHDLAVISTATGEIASELDLNTFRKTAVSSMLLIGHAKSHAIFNASEAIIGVDLITGKLKWTFPKKPWGTVPVLDKHGILYYITFESDRSWYYRIAVDTGDVLLKKELPAKWNENFSSVFTPPSVDDRFLILTTAERLAKSPYHSIIIFDKASGDLVKTIKLNGTDAAITTAPQVSEERLVQLDGEGKVHILENYIES